MVQINLVELVLGNIGLIIIGIASMWYLTKRTADKFADHVKDYDTKMESVDNLLYDKTGSRAVVLMPECAAKQLSCCALLNKSITDARTERNSEFGRMADLIADIRKGQLDQIKSNNGFKRVIRHHFERINTIFEIASREPALLPHLKNLKIDTRELDELEKDW